MDSIFKYFKIGDYVINKEVWGSKKKFVIDEMYGNAYCPILDVHTAYESKTNGNTCLFAVSMTKLVGASKRPLAKLKKDIVMKMMRNGNIEAKREFLIRAYNKQL